MFFAVIPPPTKAHKLKVLARTRTAQDDHNLPIARTCFSSIYIPVYANYEEFKSNLEAALRSLTSYTYRVSNGMSTVQD